MTEREIADSKPDYQFMEQFFEQLMGKPEVTENDGCVTSTYTFLTRTGREKVEVEDAFRKAAAKIL